MRIEKLEGYVAQFNARLTIKILAPALSILKFQLNSQLCNSSSLMSN